MKPALQKPGHQHEDFHAANECGLAGLVLRLTEYVQRVDALSPRDAHGHQADEAMYRIKRARSQLGNRRANAQQRIAGT